MSKTPGTWYEFAESTRQRHQNESLRIISKHEIVHLTALTIILNQVIQANRHIGKKEEFTEEYLTNVDTQCDDARRHNVTKCVISRQAIQLKDFLQSPSICVSPLKQLPLTPIRSDLLPETKYMSHTSTEIVSPDDCESCLRVVQLSHRRRVSHLRMSLYTFSITESRSLLHKMLIMYHCCQNMDIDLYLFLQITFAMIRLHHANIIYLRNETVCAYFLLFFQYFLEFYAEETISVKSLLGCVQFSDGITEAIFADHSIQFCLLLFLIKQDVSSDYLLVHQCPIQWKAFVSQINTSLEVQKLCASYGYDAPLFSLDIDNMLGQTNVK